MSGPLLQKLAPETRGLIYKYVLTFDTPLKHAQNMRPFLGKSGHSIESRAETSTSEDSAHESDSFERVDIAILTTNKLIYTEAIVVLYENNTFNVNTAICKPENISTLRATDLALAKHVVTKISVGPDPVTERPTGLQGCVDVGTKILPAIFPKLTSATMYLYTDTYSKPITALLMFVTAMRRSTIFDTVEFDSVGSVVASSSDNPGLKFVGQCKATVDRWEKDQAPGDSGLLSLTTKNLQRDSEGLPPGTVAPLAQRMFDDMHVAVVPPGCAVIEMGSLEFWTVIDEILREAQAAISQIMRRFEGREIDAGSEEEWEDYDGEDSGEDEGGS
ncbi:hypothetical protein MBLNU13_g05573t1 [Cladosporium sp. NU13]